MLRPKVVWVAVRKPKGEEEYPDLGTIAGGPGWARDRAKYNDSKMPSGWVEANPVVRAAQIEIREL